MKVVKACLETASMFCSREKSIGLKKHENEQFAKRPCK